MHDNQAWNKELLQVSDREQRLIAEELHDTLCQTLVGLSFLAKATVRRLENGKPVDSTDLVRMSEQLDAAIDQSRFCMQPQILASRPAGLADALKELARHASTHTDCELHLVGEEPISNPQVAQAFYRVARETVRNILSGGRSCRILVVLSQNKHGSFLKISCEPPDQSDQSLFEGDGYLRRFTSAAGLDWSIAPDGHGAALRCAHPAAENGLT